MGQLNHQNLPSTSANNAEALQFDPSVLLADLGNGLEELAQNEMFKTLLESLKREELPAGGTTTGTSGMELTGSSF